MADSKYINTVADIEYSGRLVFRETFDSQIDVIRNGATLSNITFSNGVAVFNGLETASGGHINYNLISGIHNVSATISIRFKALTPVANDYLFNLVNNTNRTAYFSDGTTVAVSSGTCYVDGVAGTTVSSATKEITITGISLAQCSRLYLGWDGSNNSSHLNASIETINIFNYALSVSEVLDLFNNARYVSFPWSSYWTTLISATVENAAPTKVVMTFPIGKPALTITDFTIAGKTISDATWVGAVLTLTVTVTFDWGDTPMVTFVRTGQTKAVTNNILYPFVLNANTVGWYDSSDLTTITKDGADRISVWADKLLSGHNLLQANGAEQPLWSADGALFNGSDEWMATLGFVYNQPAFVYLVVKHITWTNTDQFFSGVGSACFINQAGSSPKLALNAGTSLTFNDELVLNTWGIIRAFFNGVNSKLQVNNTAALAGAVGANPMSGITLGRNQAGATGFANIQVKELIFRNAADDVATETAIYNYLAVKYGFPTI